MNYAVAYYTRTNTCKRIAEKVSERLSCDLVRITDDIDWSGLRGFFKAGAYSAQDKKVEIKIKGSVDDVDELVFVTPLWAGGLAPAAKAFLKTVSRDKVHLVVTSIGNITKDRNGFKSVHDIKRVTKNENDVINLLVNQLLDSSKKNKRDAGM